jgi:hypothetical protein
MSVLKGYRAFFDRADDPSLKASMEKEGQFFIFRSFEAWKKEDCKEEDIPKKELILSEFGKNRFIAHP